MTSLRASTSLARVYAICQGDDPDTATAWLDAGAEVLESGEQTSFAAKVNLGYSKTSEPWLLLVGDDVRFRPGWLDHAKITAGDHYQPAHPPVLRRRGRRLMGWAGRGGP